MGQSSYAFILPSWSEKIYSTVIYESLREGIEDSKIIATLEKAIADNPGTKANEAQVYLNGLYSRVAQNFSSRYFYDNSSENIEKRFDRAGEMLEDLSGDSTNFSFFDSMRRTMIDYIVELQSLTPTTDSSGGGGSSAVSTTSQTKSTGTINAGETKTISFTKDFSITDIEVTAKNTFSSTIIVEDITNSPGISSSPIHPNEGAVYKYLSITAPSISQAMEKAVIKFKVTKDWLSRNNFDENTVELKRQNNGGWENLPTIKTTSNTNHAHYEAETTSFSKFAVVGKKKAGEIKEEAKEEPEEERQEIKEETIPETSFYKNLTWLWVTLIITLAMGMIIRFLKKKR
jgi:PGF-pre-PGF domain-containing protein